MVSKSEELRGRRTERTREDILLAAARALARTGYTRVTMNDIAQEAGYTVPSLYAYYASKDQIVEALGAMLMSEVLAIFEEGFPEGLTSAQRVELLIRRLFAITDRRSEALAAALTLPAGKGTTGHEVMQRRMARWFRDTEPHLVRRGKQTGEVLATALLGLCDAFVRQRMALGSRTLLVQQAPLVAELFLHGAASRLG
jgi:AcrR family transcriptional regulator